jgi:hypothetical protein
LQICYAKIATKRAKVKIPANRLPKATNYYCFSITKLPQKQRIHTGIKNVFINKLNTTKE